MQITTVTIKSDVPCPNKIRKVGEEINHCVNSHYEPEIFCSAINNTQKNSCNAHVSNSVGSKEKKRQMLIDTFAGRTAQIQTRCMHQSKNNRRNNNATCC